MNGIRPTVGIEFDDKYTNAKNKLLDFIKALDELDDIQKAKLAQEFITSYLFVFDEGHMFDDGGRGATYELLVTHIRQNITSEQQLVLLSAVLPNSGDIAQWMNGWNW